MKKLIFYAVKVILIQVCFFFGRGTTYIYAHSMENVAKTFNIFLFQFWNSRTKFENDPNRNEIKLALS